jgi:hypothetical protein
MARQFTVLLSASMLPYRQVILGSAKTTFHPHSPVMQESKARLICFWEMKMPHTAHSYEWLL